MFEFIFIASVDCLKISEKKWVAQKMAKKKCMPQKMAVKTYLVENMAVNNLWVCNMAEMKYKVENKLHFQNMATNVETSQDNNK